MKDADSMTKTNTAIQNIDFNEILSIIHSSQARALASVNRELIAMYWEIGEIVSEKIATGGWGKLTVSSLASFCKQISRPPMNFLIKKPKDKDKADPVAFRKQSRCFQTLLQQQHFLMS